MADIDMDDIWAFEPLLKNVVLVDVVALALVVFVHLIRFLGELYAP